MHSMSPKKRNKQFLDPDYDSKKVCRRTDGLWRAQVLSANSETPGPSTEDVSNLNDGMQDSRLLSNVGQNLTAGTPETHNSPERDRVIENYHADDRRNIGDNITRQGDHDNSSEDENAVDISNTESDYRNASANDTSFARSANSDASIDGRTDQDRNASSSRNDDSDNESINEGGSEDDVSSFDDNGDSTATASQSDENDEFERDERRNNARQNFHDPIMFEISGLKVSDVLFLIGTFSTRFHVSGKGKEALLELIKILAGPEWDEYTLNNNSFDQFEPSPDLVSYVFYCDTCDKKLSESVFKKNIPKEMITCDACKREYSLTSESPNSFVLLDVEYQMQLLLRNKKIQQALMENIIRIDEKRLSGDNVIEDIQDGIIYKEAVPAETNTVILTTIISTDGALVFHSSKKSMWALLLTINEFPVSIRFKNVIVAGLWIRYSEPKPKAMKLYLSDFLEKTERLRQHGITVPHYATEEEIVFKILPIFVCADSVARPVIQNRLQYNGYYSCSWCYIRGVHSGGIVKYSMRDDPPLRSHVAHLQDVRNAEQTQRIVNGVKGSCVLADLRHFDCVWGFPHDYLHGVLLGVTRQLWDLWTTAGTAYYIPPASRTLINKRLIEIKPPLYIHRLPRPLTEKCKWKATEWRSWLLYYSPLCLLNILPDEYFTPYLCLVRSIFILLQTSITERELQQCEIDLLEFVGSYEILYGIDVMTFNVHTLLHLTECVRRSGPLWATSTFPFESFIYTLKQKIKGPKGVSQQISKKVLQEARIRNGASALCATQVCVDYCEYINDRRQLNTQYEVSREGVLFIGRRQIVQNVQTIEGVDVREPESGVGNLYNRCVYKNTPWRSTAYTRPNRNNDTVCQLTSGTVVEITQFLHYDDRAYLIGKKHDVVAFHHHDFQINHIFRSTRQSDEERAYAIDHVKCKLIVIKINQDLYFCVPPNTWEIQ